jgi:hypothetical protein
VGYFHNLTLALFNQKINMTNKNKYYSLIILTLLSLSIACGDRNPTAKPQKTQTDKPTIHIPDMSEEFNQSLAQRCVYTISEIDAYCMQLDRHDTIVNVDKNGDTPVTYWKDRSNTPVKIEYGVKGESGKVTAVFRLYFVDKKLWLSDELFAKFLFDNNGELKFWLGETWTVSETKTTADFIDRKKSIQTKVQNLLHQLNLTLN